jgi:hypothetical protein
MAHSTAYGCYTVNVPRAPTSAQGLPSACHPIIFHCIHLGEPLDALLGTVTLHVDFAMTYHLAHSTAYGCYTVTVPRAPTSAKGLPSACHPIIFHCNPLGEPLDALLGTVTPHVDFFMTYHLAYCSCIWVLHSHCPGSPYIHLRSSKCLPPHYIPLQPSGGALICVIGYYNHSCRLLYDMAYCTCIWVLYSHYPESSYIRPRSSKCLPLHYTSLYSSGRALRCIVGYCNPSCRLL